MTMTNAIETTKREMYGEIKRANNLARPPFLHAMREPIAAIEERLEAHLEELRKQLKTANEDTQGANILKDEFQQRLMRMTEERDQIQGRLQAIDESYDKSQRNLGIAGDEIRRLQDAYMTALQRCSTLAQVSKENASSDDKEANALMIVLGALVDAQRIVTDWLVPDGIKAKKAMSKLVPVFDNEPLVLAMQTFEKTARRDDAMLEECAHSERNPKDSLCAECGKRFMTPAQRQEEGFRSGQIGCNGQAAFRS